VAERAQELDGSVRAWVHLREGAPELRSALDNQSRRRPLWGVPIGVKDIFEVAGMTTSFGVPGLSQNVARDQAAVATLFEVAGGVMMGKTACTEFAYATPGPTRNPRNIAHTPGGSSSGSAAAVAAEMVPLSVGSQTAGSIIRPAAYCGVTGFKPTHGLVSTAGMLTFAPSLDTVGFFALSVSDIRIALSAAVNLSGATRQTDKHRRRFGLHLGGQQWTAASVAARQTLDNVAARIRDAGVEAVEIDLGAFEHCHELHATIMAYEASRALSWRRENMSERLSPQLMKLLDEGQELGGERYLAALRHADEARQRIDRMLGDLDCVITLSAPGVAPPTLSSTGDPVCNRIWTLLGTPCVHIPVASDTAGLPLGVQLVGARWHDIDLLNAALWLSTVVTEPRPSWFDTLLTATP